MERHDYAFPFRIDGVSRQAQQSPYAAHVAQMIRQVLLTGPGERADLPEFGCGLHQLIFAPNSDPLRASTKVLVLQALEKWLSGQAKGLLVRSTLSSRLCNILQVCPSVSPLTRKLVTDQAIQ